MYKGGYVGTLLRRMREECNGQAMIMVGLTASLVFGAVSFGIEVANYNKMKSRLRNAMDQAVLSTASTAGTLKDPENYALEYLKANLPDSGAKYIGLEENFSVTSEDNIIWTARSRVKVDTVMGKLLGLDHLDIKQVSRARWDKSIKNEVVALVDVSGTMCARFKRDGIETADGSIPLVPDRSCLKLHKMQEALRKIVEIGVVGVPEDPIFKVGVVPFTFQVRLPDNRGTNVAKVAPFLLANEPDKSYFTNFSDSENGGPPLPSTFGLRSISSEADRSALFKYIDGLENNNQEIARMAWKRSSLGAQMAGLMLDPRYQTLFGGVKPNDFGHEKTRKIVILMTDSVNMGCCFTNWPQTSDYKGKNYLYSYRLDHEHLVGNGSKRGFCDLLKEEGVEIHTVLLDVEADDVGVRGNEIIDAFEGCATNPEDAPPYAQALTYTHRVALDDQKSLENAYKVIGRSLLNLRLNY